jgi:carbon-monoxide dehydrogenase medium subunit
VVDATEAAASLIGGQAGEPAFERAGVIAREAASPISDLRGPADYRVHLIGILVKRALGGAFDRARGGSRAPGITVG